MIITKPELIKLNEKSFIDSLIENLDWNKVAQVVQQKTNISDITCKKGDIVVHDNEVAYKLNLELKVDLDVIISRDGEYVNYQNVETEKTDENIPADEETEVAEDLLEEVSDDEIILDDPEPVASPVFDGNETEDKESKKIDLDELLGKE